MVKVNSSNIDEVEYIPSTKTLQIRFKNGSLYNYFDVPEEVFEEFIKSESAGKYFQAHVKSAFQFSKNRG
jgi:KTSC domain